MAEDKLVDCYLAVSPEEFKNRDSILNQTFKGENDDTDLQFPKGLGAAHPFDFKQIDKILDNVGIADSMVDKIVDAVVGDFEIKTKDPNAQAILEGFENDTNLKNKLRPWIKEAVSKGNGFMELDLKDMKNIEKLRVLSANDMYVRRNKKSKVLGYNQYKGKLKYFTAKSKPIPFTPNQIAHLTINKKPGDPYGRGLVWSNRVTIENLCGDEIDKSKVISRKAGAPIHVQLGQPGQKVRQGDMDAFKASLQYMTNSTEWVTDKNTEMKVIDFGAVGDNLTKAAEHDLEQLSLGMKIPMSILGISNNPEGLAKVNDKGFLRFIHSLRTQIEEIVENQILRPVLRNNSPKLDGEVEFIWELPDEDEKNARLEQIKNALGLMDISPELRAALEIQYAEVMGLDIADKLPTPEEARKKADKEEADLKKEIDINRKAEETKIKQPQVPGAVKAVKKNQSHQVKKDEVTPNQTLETRSNVEEDNKEIKTTDVDNQPVTISESEKLNMKLSEYVNIKELPGFNYSDYLVKILQNLRIDKFEDLIALTEKQLEEGLLPNRDINKLRIILKNGFRKNKTIRQIEKDINNSIDLKDRVKFNEDGTKVLTLSAEKRPINIARTETVRLANQGLKDIYLENNIKSYRWLAAIDERTCPICGGLDGQVFETRDGTSGLNMPPAHSMCRCSMVGLVN